MFQAATTAGVFVITITCCVIAWRGVGRDLKRIAAEEAFWARQTELLELGRIDWTGFDRARAEYERSAS